MYLVVERRRLVRPDHKAGACAHPAAATVLRLRFAAGRRAGGRVRSQAMEHWGCIRECCARDRDDPLGRHAFWHHVSFGPEIPQAAAADPRPWPAWEDRKARVAAVVPPLTAAEQARCDAWHALRLRCPKWIAPGCAAHGPTRCHVCALGRVARRRLDWARVDRAGAAWRRYRELAAREPEPASPRPTSFGAVLSSFDETSALGLDHFPCSRALVLAAHKYRILLAHPDLGGTTAEAAKVNAARETLLARLAG